MATLSMLVDRMIRDEEFRETFYRCPLELLDREDLAVSFADVCALANVPSIYFAEFARGLTVPMPPAVPVTGTATSRPQAH